MGGVAQMIGNDFMRGARLVSGFRSAANIDSLSDSKIVEFEELARSVSVSQFPGAILACPRPDDITVYYAVAQSASEWRRLQPLLLAFAGPTLTSFTGRPELLDSKVAVEDYLVKGGWYLAVRLLPGDGPSVQAMVHRSLMRLIQTLDVATYVSKTAPLPTSRLLSKFVNSLNGNDRQEALRILEVLRTEMRVDALNLSFLEVQIHAHFGDWRSVFNMPSFASLIHTRRPPTVSSALLEALYQVHLAPIDNGQSLPNVRARYEESVRADARPLVRLPVPVRLGEGAWRLYALEALSLRSRDMELENFVFENADAIGQELTIALTKSGRTGHVENSQKVPVHPDSIVEAKQALTLALEVDSLRTIKSALEKMQVLSPDQRKYLLESEPFRSMWRSLISDTQGTLPTEGWLEWLKRASEQEFANALGVARRGLAEWPVEVLKDSLHVEHLVESLTSFPEKPPGYDRLIDALPLFVAWVAEELDFPRPGMTAVYEALLFHLVSSTRRGVDVLESATTLIRALLTVGISNNEYKNLLVDVLELIGLGLGTRSTDYVLEIVEETVACPSPNPEARKEFWYQVLARIEPMAAHLSAIQVASLMQLGKGLGWDSGALQSVAEAARVSGKTEDTNFAIGLKGKSIGIYSLTEAAARQAEVLLKTLVPSIRVTLSNEHVGSPKLKSMAIGTDILVLATASATHSATLFLQQHRPRNLPLLYARGRGCTSILRALEEYGQSMKADESKALAI